MPRAIRFEPGVVLNSPDAGVDRLHTLEHLARGEGAIAVRLVDPSVPHVVMAEVQHDRVGPCGSG